MPAIDENTIANRDEKTLIHWLDWTVYWSTDERQMFNRKQLFIFWHWFQKVKIKKMCTYIENDDDMMW